MLLAFVCEFPSNEFNSFRVCKFRSSRAARGDKFSEMCRTVQIRLEVVRGQRRKNFNKTNITNGLLNQIKITVYTAFQFVKLSNISR